MKKSILNATILLFIISLTVSSCRKECQDIIIEIESLENLYGCTNTRNEIEIDLFDDAIIISSQASYNDLIDGSCKPTIDFGKYHLVIGKKSTPNLVDTIYYNYIKECPHMDLVLTVEIVLSSVPGPDNVVYHALIPPLGEEETLMLELLTTYPQK